MNERPAKPVRRRYFQFSLRVLLFSLLIAGSVTAWFATEISRAAAERKNIERLQQLPYERRGSRTHNVSIYYDYQFSEDGSIDEFATPSTPKWIRTMFGENLFTHVVDVTLNADHFDEIPDWGTFTRLRVLRLSGRGDAQLPESLSKISHVKILELSRFRDIDHFKLSELTGLEKLRLYHSGVRDLDGIQNLSSLRHLDIHVCRSLHTLEPIENVPLEVLEIRYCDPELDIRPVFSINTLQELKLTGNRNVHNGWMPDIEGLAGFPELKKLTISECGIENLEGLSESKKLQELSISSCRELTELTELSEISSLEKVCLNRCSIESLSGLESSTGLESLQVTFNWSLTDFSALEKLTALKQLTIGVLDDLDNLPDPKCVPALRELDLTLVPELNTTSRLPAYTSVQTLSLRGPGLHDIEGLQNLGSLRTVALDCETLENIDGLSGCTNLEVLTMEYCQSLKNLDGIPRSKVLRKVELSDCDSLENFEGLRNVDAVEELSIQGCPFLVTCEPMEHLVNLKWLGLNNSSNLESLDGLQSAKHLEVVVATQCDKLKDVSAIIRLENLKEVNIDGVSTTQFQLNREK